MINMTVGQRKMYATQHPQAEDFWRNLLDGVAPSCLRADMPEGRLAAPGDCAYPLDLPAPLTQRLRQAGKQDPAAMSLLLTAAVAMFCHLSTGEDDLLLANPAPEGSINGLMPLRLTVNAQDSLSQVAQRLLAQARTAEEWLDFPIDLLGFQPQLVVAFVRNGQIPAQRNTAQLLFCFSEEGDSLHLRLVANAERYRTDTLQRIAGQLSLLLDKVLHAAQDALDTLDLLQESDRQLITRINNTVKPVANTSLTALFEQSFRQHADKTAIYDAEQAWSYAQLDTAAGHVAHLLIRQGVKANDIVAVVAQRSFEMMAAMIGVLKAGAAWLPIAPDLPASRIAYLLNDSQAKIVLTQPEWQQEIAAGCQVILLDKQELMQPQTFEPVTVSPQDAAYLIYTSGSTGNPKGVIIEHHSVVNRLKWMQSLSPLQADDVILQKTTISFDVSVWELFWWLLEGAAVSLLAPGAEKEPEAVAAAIADRQVTTLHFVPTMLGAFLEYVAAAGQCQRLASLRNVFASGEALSRQHVKAFARLVPQARLINLYGPTEATVDVSWHITSPQNEVVTIGKPIDNIRLYVLDSQMRQRPIGMTGELYIAGVGLARHYHNRPELTAERFVPAVHLGESRLYKTGDLVRWLDNGELEYLGRNDFQVKLRGFRIELGEIEQALQAQPGVTDARAIVRRDGSEQARLLAYVIAEEGFAEQPLQTRLREVLPGYMVPERIVAVEAFPLSPSGKLNAGALPQPGTLRSDYVAPRSEPERVLAAIWGEVLNVAQVGVTESFFALGGNSIHFVSVLAKAQKAGYRFTFQQLFQYPTIEALLAHGGQSANGDEPPREFAAFELITASDRARMPQDIEDAYPMSMLQAGLIYQSELMHSNNSYHDIVSYLIQGAIRPDIFRQAMRIMVGQNAVFRTSYHLKEFSEYLQLVHRDDGELPLEIEDLRHLTSDEQQEEWYSGWFAREQGREFAWERPGLVRLHVHILRDDLYRYSISQHNSALDGWSMNQLHTRLFALYYSLLAGGEVTETAGENHVRNFIGLERHAIHSPAHIAFWQQKMADYPRTAIPRLRASQHHDVPQVVFQDIALPEGLSGRIIRLAQTLGVPVKNVLLAAHLKVHAFLNASTDVLTGYEHGGRPELPGADRALGVFLNTLPLRVNLAEGSWSDLIRQTWQAEADLLPYRRYPMAKVKQDLRLKALLFETVFNFTHFYSLKALKSLPEFSLLEVRAAAITEFPLRMEFSQHFYSDEVQVSLHYHAGEFDAHQILNIGGYITRILQAMTENPRQPHHHQELLSEDEKSTLAAFSQRHPERLRVVDGYGNLLPVGSTGYLVAPGQQPEASSPQGKWLSEGVLHGATDTTAPAADCAPARRQPEQPSAHGVSSFVAEKVTRVWAEVLNMAVSDCRHEDDFFENGGNSLAAMRLVMLLEGAVGLRDMMQYSLLGELIEVAGRSEQNQQQAVSASLLVPLSEVKAAVGSFVCLPYAGGNALHFKPFAAQLGQRLPDLNVYAVELPGHHLSQVQETLQPFAQVAERIADEIAALNSDHVCLWGHCVGSALAIEVARQLQQRGIEVRHVFLAAKLLYQPEAIQETLRNAEKLSFEDIRHLYAEWSGEDGLQSITPEAQAFMTNTFRHDSLEANRYLLSRLNNVQVPLSVPATLVIAGDDSATTGYQSAFPRWQSLVADIMLRELPQGGHYFMRTQPERVAELVKYTLS